MNSISNIQFFTGFLTNFFIQETPKYGSVLLGHEESAAGAEHQGQRGGGETETRNKRKVLDRQLQGVVRHDLGNEAGKQPALMSQRVVQQAAV